MTWYTFINTYDAIMLCLQLKLLCNAQVQLKLLLIPFTRSSCVPFFVSSCVSFLVSSGIRFIVSCVPYIVNRYVPIIVK